MTTDTIQKEPAQAGCAPVTGSDVPTFELHRYNPRRAARGAEAAEVKVTWPDGETEYLWMSKRDILANLKERGESKGLRDALEAYRQNKKVSDAPDSAAPNRE